MRERERKEEEKLKKKQELAAEWTKREKQDFYRALVTYPIILNILYKHLSLLLDMGAR